MVSVKRIEKFLFAEEIDHKSEEQKGENRIAFSMKNGNYYWGKEQKDTMTRKKGRKRRGSVPTLLLLTVQKANIVMSACKMPSEMR